MTYRDPNLHHEAPYDLSRFVDAQERVFDQALREIRCGKKSSHWMWFIFPQFAGLGSSEMAREYAISSVEEARDYLADPVLGKRLIECAQATINVPDKSALQIFGTPDDLKFRSSMTLFAHVSPPGSIFAQALDRFFHGAPDSRTVGLIGKREPTAEEGSPTKQLKRKIASEDLNDRSVSASDCSGAHVKTQSENRSDQSVPPSWHWWLLRLGLAVGIIAVSLQIKSKEGMWIFAVGVLLLLATIVIGALRASQKAWQSSSKPVVNPPKQQACGGQSADPAKPD